MRTYGAYRSYRRHYGVTSQKNIIRAAILVIVLISISVGYYKWGSNPEIGDQIDNYKGVAVYYNGSKIDISHGQHYSADGYYYGQKWQCVEFVKRFYYEALKHCMPDTLGHARDFWDNRVPSGKLNHRRGLLQYRNGGTDKPQADDLLVFTNGQYGHVAVISKVGEDYIEVVQQNVEGYTRQVWPLFNNSGRYFIGDGQQPAGWLRLKKTVIKP